jgi:hypothetical protein
LTDYIQTKTKDGRTIRIEVEAAAKVAAGFGGRQPSPVDVSTAAVDDVYEQVLNTVRDWANGFVETLQSLEAMPSSAAIDFALKVDAEAGTLVAKSRENAHFKVSLTWKQAGPDEDDRATRL